MGGSGGEEESSSSLVVREKKVKFLCSHGGRIVPRPSDGHLKYVGGESRVISVPRHITFTELKKRVSEMVEGETILKYQIIPEELDILVSVKNDQDVKHMIQQYDQNSPKQLRAFLFPSPSPNLHRVRSSPTIFRRQSSFVRAQTRHHHLQPTATTIEPTA